MPDTRRLLTLVPQRLRDGALPSAAETTALGGRSQGARCTLCGQDIEVGSADIELAWAEAAGRRSVLLHPACHAAWLVVARHGDRVAS